MPRDYVEHPVAAADPASEDPRRCVIYCRVSSDRQREAHTIGSQRELLVAYAEAAGWSVLDVAEDDGVSGEVEPWARPGMSRVLDLVRKRAVDVLLVIDIDRISRDSNNIAFGIVRRDLREHGVRLATARGMLDLDSPEQRLQQDILAALASFERHKILERTIRGRKNAVLRGERPLAKPPLAGDGTTRPAPSRSARPRPPWSAWCSASWRRGAAPRPSSASSRPAA